MTTPGPREVADGRASVAAVFAAIDAKDAARFASYLADDAAFVYANAPPVVGREAVRVAVDGFFGSVRSLSHALERVWTTPEGTVVEGRVRYVRHDARDVALPFVVVFDGPVGRISSYRIYVDGAPLYAA